MNRRHAWLAGAAGAITLAACGQGGFGGDGDGAPVDIQAVHPAGVVVQVLSIRSAGEATLVNLRIINGREREARLNSGNEATYLLTGAGEKLLLTPSPTNANLAIPGDQVMDAALVFSGQLPRGDSTTLILNASGSADSEYSNSPRFEIRIPLDGAFGGGRMPEASALSNMQSVPRSRLGAAAAGGSSLGAAGGSESNLRTVEALKSELGAVETERGTVVSLPGDVTFDFDEATIRDDARPTLDRLAQLIQAGGEGRITVEGHTDSRGDDAYNQRLSERRAEAVKAYLVQQGVSADRLATLGLGERRPVAPNARPDGSDDEAGRQRNRRVEVILPNAPNAEPATSG